jgi:hypothetical protein
MRAARARAESARQAARPLPRVKLSIPVEKCTNRESADRFDSARLSGRSTFTVHNQYLLFSDHLWTERVFYWSNSRVCG